MVPILLTMFSLSALNYWREWRLFDEQVHLAALQLGEAMRGSLYHAMLTDDREMVAEILANVSQMENIQGLQIIDLDGRVKVDSRSQEVGKVRHPDSLGCKECHQFPPEERPHTTRLASASNTLRIATPISNGPECEVCHTEDAPHLGVLLVDLSSIDFNHHILNDLRSDLLITGGITLLVILGLQLIHIWVVRRKLALREPLARLAAGDYTVRLSSSSGPLDELGKIASVFNQMAAELERRARELDEQHTFQRQAIAEERARIARDLHDGLAQLLGYINTKAMAVRLMLNNQEIEGADQHLFQLEEAARELFIDVREAILNLRMASQDGAGLTTTLKGFTVQFSRLSGLPVELSLAPAVEGLALPAETEQHLLRIVQESLTNVRKHASAAKACVSLKTDGNILEMMVADDGQGFDPDRVKTNGKMQFGLSTMRERAEEIGAQFCLDSKPGAGTCVTVRLPLKDPSQRS